MKPFWLSFGLKPTQTKTADSGPYYADIHSRGLAAVIDMLLIFSLLERPFGLLNQRILSGTDRELLEKAREASDSVLILKLLWQSNLPQLWMANSAIQILVVGIIIVTAQYWFRTTPGKWLLGLRIVRVNTLEPLLRWQYFLRFLAYIPACLPLMLGIFWMSFNKRHRGWHDMIAGTVVIHTHPRGWVWQQIKRGFLWLRTRIRSSQS